MKIAEHYKRLYQKESESYGAFESETFTSIVGFSAGGPVSMLKVAGKAAYVTCELSPYSEQKRSMDGMKFELLFESELDKGVIQSALTALGNLSMSARLGDGHTIDLSPVMPPNTLGTVSLSLYSRSGRFWNRCGIYQVHLASKAGTGCLRGA